MTTAKMIDASSHRLSISLMKPAVEQDIDQDVVELGEEPLERPGLLALRQAVRPIGLQPLGRLLGVQTAGGIDAEPLLDLLRRQGVPGRRIQSRQSRVRLAHPGTSLEAPTPPLPVSHEGRDAPPYSPLPTRCAVARQA